MAGSSSARPSRSRSGPSAAAGGRQLPSPRPGTCRSPRNLRRLAPRRGERSPSSGRAQSRAGWSQRAGLEHDSERVRLPRPRLAADEGVAVEPGGLELAGDAGGRRELPTGSRARSGRREANQASTSSGVAGRTSASWNGCESRSRMAPLPCARRRSVRALASFSPSTTRSGPVRAADLERRRPGRGPSAPRRRASHIRRPRAQDRAAMPGMRTVGRRETWRGTGRLVRARREWRGSARPPERRVPTGRCHRF